MERAATGPTESISPQPPTVRVLSAVTGPSWSTSAQVPSPLVFVLSVGDRVSSSTSRERQMWTPRMNDPDKELLGFEREHPRTGGSKDHAVREALGLEPTVYFARLNALLDDPDAYLFDPQLVKRLRRLRDRRRATRASA